MKDKWLLGVSLAIYILGTAALVVELFRFTTAPADAASTTSQQVQHTDKGLTIQLEHWRVKALV